MWMVFEWLGRAPISSGAVAKAAQLELPNTPQSFITRHMVCGTFVYNSSQTHKRHARTYACPSAKKGKFCVYQESSNLHLSVAAAVWSRFSNSEWHLYTFANYSFLPSLFMKNIELVGRKNAIRFVVESRVASQLLFCTCLSFLVTSHWHNMSCVRFRQTYH